MKFLLICIMMAVFTTLQVAPTRAADALPPLVNLDLQQKVDQAIAQRQKTILIPAGHYRVKRTVLRHADDLTIEGAGVQTVLVNPEYADTFVIVDSSGVTLKNLAVDYDPLPFVQAMITSAAADGTSFEFQTLPGYPDLASDYAKKAVESVAYFFDGKTHLWKRYVPHGYFKKKEILSATRGRLTGPTYTFFDYSSVQAGDLVVFPIKNYGNAIQIQNSRDIRVENVTVYSAPGAGYIARRMRGEQFCQMTISRDAPPPTGASVPRLLSTCADGFNCIVAEKGPVLDGCDFSFMGDDGVNLSGPSWVVGRIEDEHTIILASRYAEPWLSHVSKLGESTTIHFNRRGSAEPLGEGYAESVQEDASWRNKGLITQTLIEEQGFAPEAQRPAYFYRMRFKDNLPSSLAVSDLVWSPDLSNPHFVIRNSRITDNRGAGLSIRASHGIIENNHLERNKYLGIGLGPLFALWNEAGWVDDVVVRNNHVIDANDGQQFYRSPLQDHVGAIAVYHRQHVMPQRYPYYPGNKNIVIENNIIDGAPVCGIWINAAQDVTVRNNIVRRTGQMDGRAIESQINLSTSWAITIQNSLRVTTEGNRIENSGPYSRGDIADLGPDYTSKTLTEKHR